MRYFTILALILMASPLAAFTAERGTFHHDGRERIHYFYAPVDADDTTSLVIVLHGMGGNAKALRFGLGMTEALEEEGFAVVYPQGVRLKQGSRHWNAGFDFMKVDDVGYLTALAEWLAETHGLSRRNVMVLGISMGGYMAYHMACNAALDLAGIVVVAATMHPKDWEHCDKSDRPSLLHVHGADDTDIPYGGGPHWSTPDGAHFSVRQVALRWAAALGARPVSGVVLHDNVDEKRFLSEQSGREVQFLTLDGFGHDWPSETTANYRAIDDMVAFMARQRDARRR